MLLLNRALIKISFQIIVAGQMTKAFIMQPNILIIMIMYFKVEYLLDRDEKAKDIFLLSSKDIDHNTALHLSAKNKYNNIQMCVYLFVICLLYSGTLTS